jgi:mono/diheme cytochrome c family protein
MPGFDSGHRELLVSAMVWSALVVSMLLAGTAAGSLPAQRAAPPPASSSSIEAGRRIYLRYCVSCHDPKGKPVPRAEPGSTRPADLTAPREWVHGMRDSEMLDTLLDGTEEMLGFRGKISEEDLRRVIRFVQSLWPAELRPKPPAP